MTWGFFVILSFSIKVGVTTIATYLRKLKDSSGNYILPTTRSKAVYLENNTTLQNWIDKVAPLLAYPVGAIYQSTSGTSPASLFGGTWTKIENHFLYGSGTKNVGTTGGEEEHKLDQSELPSFEMDVIPTDSDSGVSYPGTYFVVSRSGQQAAAYLVTNPTSGWGIMNWGATRVSVWSGGSDTPHNNMPPYEVVNIWKRVS